ncbi:FadR/GntR family transcriptional regulator [Marinovum sp. SP66]|uniref:FadR/GntR family transcriptional regulator n=1 Tax=Marinovum sp. SP66 TaxID=3028379 RepID=UPI00237A739B|nr:FadR/GntR family transcriptional regulator [Marinovum sp. SP66]MDD9739808.1 FadR/GntR family transcriptional regulator [Marinovum sp. SP66]
MKNQKTIGSLLNFIRDRKYESGERLPSERELALKFGITRQYIREAITTLEAMRVVERRPSSGIFLRDLNSESSFEALVLHAESGLPLQPKEVADALETRLVLEVQAVEFACMRRTDEDIVKLEGNLEKTRARLDKSDSIEVEDREFHQLIVASTGNHVLVRLVNSFFEMSHLRRKLFFADQAHCRRSYEEHRSIFEAIQAHDSATASEAIHAHLSQTMKSWEELLTAGSDTPE